MHTCIYTIEARNRASNVARCIFQRAGRLHIYEHALEFPTIPVFFSLFVFLRRASSPPLVDEFPSYLGALRAGGAAAVVVVSGAGQGREAFVYGW